MKKIIKKLVLLFLSVILLSLFSCGQGEVERLKNRIRYLEREISDCESAKDDLESQISNIEYIATELSDNISEIRSEVDDFGYDDWEDNVYDVEYATSEAEGNIRDLINEF